MSKSIRHHKKSSKQQRKNNTRKIRSRIRKVSKYNLRRSKVRGGNGEKVKCCMCGKIVDIKDTLIPRECLMKHGKAAHRICEDCWWDPNSGFGLETSSHECPGCKNGLPLTQFKKEEPIFVDLTEE
jgi:hypothetical protein